MKFSSTQIKGKGRGKPMGFPTINLKIPKNFKLQNGIYAAKVNINNRIFNGALHYGPVPTFNESEKSLEVFLLETNNKELENLKVNIIKIKIIKYLRPIIKFDLKEDLIKQIKEDVLDIQKLNI